MKKLIYGGVRSTDTGYTFDYNYDYPDDILDIVSPILYTSSIGDNIYWFGYKFKDHVDSKTRSKFLHFLKGLSEPSITPSELHQFIYQPLKELNKYINTYKIDCIVYPISNRSDLVKEILKETTRFMSRDSAKCSFGLVKSAPTHIEFDWDLFRLDNEDNPSYTQMVKHVEENILPKIHSLDYFSLANEVKPRYRRYIKNFLNFDEDTLKKFQSLHSKNILVIDDINTSGSTIDEIVRILRNIDTNSNIYIFTLIGRE